MTTADRFASEWQSILGVVHRTTTPYTHMGREFDDFVQIPGSRRVSAFDNGIPMSEIDLSEVIVAIEGLNRHKAAGADGINNDLFKDTQAIMAPAMVAVSNELLQGGLPSASFLEGIIISLRKQGDLDDAMDYRPIALLQTGYKIFTKVIAERV